MVNSGHHVFLRVFRWPYEDHIAFRSKDAAQQSIAGSQNSENLCDCGILPWWAYVSGNEGNPHSTENKHAEGDESGLVKVVWEFPCQESQEEADAGQQADVAQDEGEGDGWAFIAEENDHGTFTRYQFAWCWGSDHQPHDADNYLH